MIERHWKGITTKENAPLYIAHLQNDTFRQLAMMKGFISAAILKRDVKESVEFLIVTKWETIDAIRQFAGSDTDTAVVPPFVRKIMLKYDDHVRHYELHVGS